jgi:hypothetical protein
VSSTAQVHRASHEPATSGRSVLSSDSNLHPRGMRGGIVAAGVIMMVFGAVLFFGSFGSIGTQGLNGASILSAAGFGVILGFIGFIVFIAGLAASPEYQRVSRSGYDSDDDAPRPAYYAPPAQYHVPPASAASPAPSNSSEPVNADDWVRERFAAYMGSPNSSSAQRAQPVPTPASPASAVTTSPVPPAGSGVFCPYCGTPTKPEYMFCRSCGKQAPAE